MFLGSLARGRRKAPIVVQGNGTPLAGYAWFPQPDDTPSLTQTGMDSFNPTVLDSSPHASAPIISRITHKGKPGRCVWVAGHQFDDSIQLWVYSEANGAGNFLQAAMIPGSRVGNRALFRIHASSVANSFMLGWLYHPTYGWSEPYPINAPEVFTLHGSHFGKGSLANPSYIAVRVGDDIRVGGINLSSKQATQRCWLYFVRSGVGTWVQCHTVDEGHAIATVPSLSTGVYDVWAHTGRGGRWGWNKCRIGQMAVESATAGVGPGSWQSDKDIGAPSGSNDDAAFTTAFNSIGTWNTAYIALRAGTYYFSTSKNLQTGFAGVAHIKGAGINSTTIKFASGANVQYLFTSIQSAFLEDLTLDFSDGVGSFSGEGPVAGFKRMKNVRILLGTRNKTCFQTEGGGYTSPNRMDGCEFSGGLDGYTVIGSDGWLSNSTLICRNLVEGAIFSVFGKNNQACDNVTVQDFSASDTGRGRFYIRGYDNRGCSICNCTTINLKVGGSDQNKGEQILFDGGSANDEYFASGGTTTTVEVDPAIANAGTLLYQSSTASSSNATSSTPTLNFALAGGDNRFNRIEIVSGTNTIPGVYVVTSYGNGTCVLSGGPIGTTASISNVVARGLRFNHVTTRTDLASSNATSSTSTVSSAGAPFDANDVGRFLYCYAGTNWLAKIRKITAVNSGIATLDGDIGSVDSISSGTGRTFSRRYAGQNGLLLVVGGTGVGQFAEILDTTTGSNGDRMVFTLDRAFRIPLDSTSRFKICSGTIDIALFNNTLSGDGGQSNLNIAGVGGAVSTDTGASSGFESFSPNAGFYAWGGSISGVRQAIVDWAIGNIGGVSAAGFGPSASLWNYFGDLTVSNCAIIARLWSGGTSEAGTDVELALSMLCDLTAATNKATFWLASWNSKNMYCIDNVTSPGNGTVVFAGSVPGGTMYANACSVSLGSGAFSGSRVIHSGSSLTVTQDNPSSGQFTGFQA